MLFFGKKDKETKTHDKNKSQGAKIEAPFSAYCGDEPYIFVSYAHADTTVVFPIIKELHERGAKLWYDEGINPGNEWPQVIAEKIGGCDALILFVTPSSISSHHVRQEINFANSKYKHILPVYLEPTKVSAGVEMVLSVFQSVFMYEYKGREDKFIDHIYGALTEGFVAAGAEVTALDIPDGEGAALRLDSSGDQSLPAIIQIYGDKFVIGRFDISVGVKQCDFEFAKETRNISRRHASLERDGDGYTVTDLGSKGGTWVNGKRIPAAEATALSEGDSVSFGNAGATYIIEY